MMQKIKSLQVSAQILRPVPASPSQAQIIPTSIVPHVLKTNDGITRRDLTICTGSSLLFLTNTFPISKVLAEEDTPDSEQGNLEVVTKTKIAEDDPPGSDQGNPEEVVTKTKIAEEDPPGSDQGNPEEVVAKTKIAEEDPSGSDQGNPEEVVTKTNGCTDATPTKQAFLDVSIDGKPAGRIIIGLYGADVPAGSARFLNLVSGAAGISYRRKEFVKIMPTYVQHGGVRSYGVDAELARKTGSSLAADDLVSEWARSNERCPGTKNVAGSVSIVVRDPSKPPPKLKLVARKGKFVIDEEPVGTDPNGTEFVITTKDSPELDKSSLVVGRVLDGMEVVEKIAKVETVQENSSSPYFRVAKLIGDKRAVVAERGFNRPYSKIIVTNCGLIA